MATYVSNTCFSGRGLSCLRSERIVFSNLSFSLNLGGALLLEGPNGSGKSSLLRLLAGLLYPATGSLFWKGRPITNEQLTHATIVRYVGHLDAIKPVLSVAESLVFWGKLIGLERKHVQEAVANAMACFDLESLANTPGKLLSSGQKRRANLARLLLGASDLWLLDEPTIALDHRSIDVLSTMIAAHRFRGGIVVLSTHTTIDLPQAQCLNMCDFAVDSAIDIQNWI